MDIQESMSKDWPVYFGDNVPWKCCNIRGAKSKNARKRIWRYIKQLQKEGFKSEGRRRRSLTADDDESRARLAKRRKATNDRKKKHYWLKKVYDIVPETDRVELALEILEDYFPGSKLWFTKVRPNMQHVIISFLFLF